MWWLCHPVTVVIFWLADRADPALLLPKSSQSPATHQGSRHLHAQAGLEVRFPWGQLGGKLGVRDADYRLKTNDNPSLTPSFPLTPSFTFADNPSLTPSFPATMVPSTSRNASVSTNATPGLGASVLGRAGQTIRHARWSDSRTSFQHASPVGNTSWWRSGQHYLCNCPIRRDLANGATVREEHSEACIEFARSRSLGSSASAGLLAHGIKRFRRGSGTARSLPPRRSPSFEGHQYCISPLAQQA